MEKAFMIQKQARDNVQNLKTYLTDLQNWESEMKRKEAALNEEFEQDLPPVRSKVKREKPLVPAKTTEKRISSSDYSSWEKFDVDKACEEVDMADVGPSSLDSKKSQEVKLEKLREEALYEKERGNSYVKEEKWNEAIACYNRAIELVKDDAIFYANRGLCYLKKESLHLAESDCNEALKLDPTYVKAYQRRATARELLGSLRAATKDLEQVLKLEPHNKPARKQLEAIRTRMGTKGAKSKSSPASTPSAESKPITAVSSRSKILELDRPDQSPLDKWRDGVGENITVIKPVKKPPHLRSKRPLKQIQIKEVPLGKTSPEKPPTRMKIIEIADNADTANNNIVDNNITANNNIVDNNITANNNIVDNNITGDVDNKKNFDVIADDGIDKKMNGFGSPESQKLVADSLSTEKETYKKEDMVPPLNSVQFMSEWKCLKDQGDARSDYLSIIEPQKIPSIFSNALESDVLSELLRILYDNPDKFKHKSVASYLRALSSVKRFSTLAMFLSTNDKNLINQLLVECKKEGSTDEEILHLRSKYEL